MELRTELEGDPSQVARARRLVGDALSRWGVGGADCEVTVLLVSELVTNALLHSRPPFELHATRAGDTIRVEMSDADPEGWPAIRPARHDVPGGRGLRLVRSLSSAWGTERDPRGKRVWFELALDDAR